jgi:hypothetical protein
LILVVVVLYRGGPAAFAQQATPNRNADQVMASIRAFDSIVQKGFYCEGTEVGRFSDGVEALKMKWELTCGEQGTAIRMMRTGDAKISYHEAAKLGMPRSQSGNISVGALATHVLFFGKEYSSQRREDTVMQVSPDGRMRELGSATVVQLRSPDAQEMTLPLMKIFLSAGRMYSQFVDEVVTITGDRDGLLHILAKGHIDKRTAGTWTLKVDPVGAYIVREASFTPREGRSPLFEVRNQGITGDDAIPIATSATWRQAFPDPENAPRQLAFDSVASSVRDALMLEAQKAMKEPYPANTVFMDDRSVPPIIKRTPARFGPGQAIPLAEDAIEEVVADRLREFPGGVPQGNPKRNSATPASQHFLEARRHDAPQGSEALAPTGNTPWPLCAGGAAVAIGLAAIIYAAVRRRYKRGARCVRQP